MALATANAAGQPAVRMVLLKGHDARGFVFYTNQQGRKANDLAENPQAALLFHWKSLRRQVRIEGPVRIVADAEADANLPAQRFPVEKERGQLGRAPVDIQSLIRHSTAVFYFT